MGETEQNDEMLDREEDNELRLLTWFKLVGNISETSRRRIAQLRSRDRRKDVRDPRPDPANIPPPLHPSRYGIRTPTELSEKSESKAAS